MLEAILIIILLPLAMCAAIFTVSLGIATVKTLFKRKKKSESLTE